MPRKKLNAEAGVPPVVESTEPQAAPETAPAKTKRIRKTEEPPTAPAVAAKTSRTRKQAAPAVEPEPVAVVEPAPVAPAKPRASRAKKVTEPAVPAPAPVAEVAAPKTRRTTKKVEAPAAAVDADGDELFVATFRPRTATAVKPKAAKATDPTIEDAPASAEAKPAPRGRGRGRKAEPLAEASAVEAVVVFPEFDEDGFPIPSWRPRSSTAVTVAATDEAAETRAEGSEDESGGRRRRGRRRGRGRGAQEPTQASLAKGDDAAGNAEDWEAGDDEEEPQEQVAKPAPVVKKAPEPVVAPSRPVVAIPPHAPQVVIRDGIPTLVRNGKVYPPIVFFGSADDEKRAENVLSEAKMAAEAGIHVFSVIVDFEVDRNSVDDNVALAAFMLNKLSLQDTEAQVIFRVTFKPPRNWSDRYRDARYLMNDGTLAEPSVCDDEFWTVARECLGLFTKKLRLLPQAGNILGVHLDRGEWFLGEGWGYDTSTAARQKFRQWARVRYGNDEVALRANWFDGRVRFDTIEVPVWQANTPDGEQFVRASRKQRRYVDYHLFLSDETVARIADLAHSVKEASEGEFLVGASYGYTFEWSHPASGHLSLGKLLRAPEIDFIAGPPSYRNREPGGTAAFPCPIDSLALNGKLYLSEEDFKTSLSTGVEPDDFNPALKTPQALDSVHWRGVGAALAHGAGVCWMDLWGNGWLNTSSIWDRGAKVREALTLRMGAPAQDPDVIVFIDERALAYLVDGNAFRLLVQNVRESILRAGLSAGFYLLSDLAHREHFPEAKLYLFLNAWDVRPELRTAIKNRLQKDDKVLFWLYSAGLFDGGRDSLERVREVTGIALKPQPFHSRSGSTILNRRHPLCEAFPERQLSAIRQLEPSYFAIPEDAVVLGEYSQTGLPSFVVKQYNGETDAGGVWTSVFLGEPHVNPQLMRALANMAGAHVWSFQDDVVHVRPPFLTVHCSGAGTRTIALPSNWSAYSLLTDQWMATEGFHLKFHGNDGTTLVFLVGNHAEIEHLLERPKDDLLTMAALPPRDTNVREDLASFDVPIMKLGEWMGENSDSEDNVDEWFLRPIQEVEEQTEVSDSDDSSRGRGRGRRRRRSGRGGTEEGATFRREPSGTVVRDADTDMSVMFRKRD